MEVPGGPGGPCGPGGPDKYRLTSSPRLQSDKPFHPLDAQFRTAAYSLMLALTLQHGDESVDRQRPRSGRARGTGGTWRAMNPNAEAGT